MDERGHFTLGSPCLYFWDPFQYHMADVLWVMARIKPYTAETSHDHGALHCVTRRKQVFLL